MISPRTQDEAREHTPPVQHHPMILRSACRICECTADNAVTPTFSQSSERSRRNYRKNRKPVNGNLHCPQNTHYSEINKTSEDQSCCETINFDQVEDFDISNSSEVLKAWNVTRLEGDLTLNLADKQLCKPTKQSSAYVRQKFGIISRNLIQDKNSVFYKSFFKRIISGTSAIKHSYSSTVKHSSVVKHSSAIKNGDSSANNLSGYSAKSETAELNHANRIENCLNESMSRTRLETRKAIASVRHLHNTDEGNVQSVSVTNDGLRRNRFISKEFHAAEHKTKEVFAINSRRSYQNSDVSQGSLLSHSFRSINEDCNAEAMGLSPNQRRDQMFLSHPQEESLCSTPTLNKNSRLSLAGWLLEASRWLFWKCIYHNICEVLLFDSWILSRSRSIGKKKVLFLLLLFLLPYLLLGRYSENGESQLSLHSGHVTKFTRKFSSFFSYYLSSLFYSVEGGNEYIQTKDENQDSLESWFHFWKIFDRKVLNDDPKESNSLQSSLHMVAEEGMNKEKMKSVAQEVFKEESSQLVKQLDQKYQIKFTPNEKASKMKSLIHQMSTMHSQYQFLSDSLHNLKLEVNRKLDAQNAESISTDQMVTSKLGILEEKIKALEALLVSTKQCCKNHSDYIALIDSHFNTLLRNVMEGKENSDTPILTAFRSWLGSNFVNHKEFSDEIATIVSRMHGDYMEFSKVHLEKIAKGAAETIIAESILALKKDIMNEATDIPTLTHSHKETLSVADMKKIVKDAILLYDADKIGLVDYALESGGGSVVSTRCSETYDAGTARLSVLGFPLWFVSNSPRTAIQPDMQPGQCWAFKGSQGFLVIQLSATIRPTGFSLEHIPEVLSPTGTIDSAPREVSVWGLSSEKANDGVLLAEYEYDKNGEPLQYIPVKKTDENFYSYVELKILSNWGNQRFTCLYRFRVHGSRL